MDREWKLALIKETLMCGYDIQGCQNHMDIYVGDHTNEPCEDCGCTEDCYKVIYTSPNLQLGYVWKGTTYSEEGEYTFYPTVEQANEVFNSLINNKSEINAYSYGVAEFDETANNCLTPMEVKGSYNL